METSPIERIEAFCRDKGIGSLSELGKLIGASVGTFSVIKKRSTRPGSKVMEMLVTKYPDLSSEWILYGAGTMYRNNQRLAAPPTSEPADRITLPESLPHQVLTPRMVAEPNLDHLSEAQQAAYWKSLYQGLRRQVDARDHEEALRFAQPARRLAAVGKTSASSDAASPAATACAHYNLATGQRVEEQQLAVAA